MAFFDKKFHFKTDHSMFVEANSVLFIITTYDIFTKSMIESFKNLVIYD